MGRKVEKPKEELAPAYFMQYSALWCIMLSFFVMLLTMGKEQSGGNDSGVGAVRDAFGSQGGLGLKSFAKNAFGKGDAQHASLRIIRKKEAPSYDMDGFVRGMLSSKGLTDVSMWVIETESGAPEVVLSLPIEYVSDTRLTLNSVRVLEILGEVIFHLTDHQFDCIMHVDEGGDILAEQKRAMLRTAVVARFISEGCGLPPGAVRAVGYSDSRYLEAHGINNVSGKLLLSIRHPDGAGKWK